MAYFPDLGQGFNGLNLSDYYPRRQGFNSVVYIRKKFPKPAKQVHNDTSKDTSGAKTVDTSRSHQRGKDQHDKSPSITRPQREKSHVTPKKRKSKTSQRNDESVLEQTVKFVKNIVPLVLPSEGSPPLYYTIKSNRVTKKDKKVKKHNKETQHEVVREHKSLVETFRKENCVGESSSMRESLSRSSRSNTVERINLNQSLVFSLSEISEKKEYRHCTPTDSYKANQQQNMQKLIASDSLEALAADISRSAGCTKIKIQLMNEKDKALLSESIRAPVLHAIVQCVEVLVDNCNAEKSELIAVQKNVQCNTEKLDTILNKLACITDNLSKANNKTPLATPHLSERPKASTLETLGEDLPEMKEDSSFEENEPSQISYAGHESEVKAFSPIKVVIKNHKQNKILKEVTPLPNLGCGETRGSLNEVVSNRGQSVMDAENGQRIATRFCWTDATAKPEVYSTK